MKQITKDWLETAKLDLEAIPYLLENERLTGQVAFHAQQAIEKSLKAIIEESGQRVPKIHSLSKLFDICESFVSIQSDEEIIIALDSLYIESRYPGEFGLLPDGKPNQKQAKAFYNFALFVFEVINAHLQQ